MERRLDRYTIVFEIVMNTKYNEDYLLSLSDKELMELYKEVFND
ncbi:MAG TPA: hypothetical protein VLA13_01470 [Massilibacterium sp.]|nr:hypothetical protein [Massilibacterium sp.]